MAASSDKTQPNTPAQSHKSLVAGLIGLAVFIVLFLLLSRLLTPKYVETLKDGGLIREYYKDDKDHDIVFFGDCEVYEAFMPSVLADEYGFKAFVRGSACQRIWQSYYLMEETLTYEKPEYFVFNVQSMCYDTPDREEYNRLTLDGMKWTKYKKASIKESMTEGESMLSYIFPIFRYHDRWKELSSEDFKYFFSVPLISDHGYLSHTGSVPAVDVPTGKPLGDYALPQRSFDYLDKMVSLCRENGVTLVLVKAPVLYPYWYPEWDEQIRDYAGAHGLAYYNFLERGDQTAIDYTTDTYDGGQHLNDDGAEKLTSCFADLLLYGEDLYYSFDFVDNAGGNSISLRPGEHFYGLYGIKPRSYYEADSCALEGCDKIYTYNGFEVTVSSFCDDDNITCIRLTDDTYCTSEGVYIGMGLADITSAYGRCTPEHGVCRYELGNTVLSFILKDEIIISIEYTTIDPPTC